MSLPRFLFVIVLCSIGISASLKRKADAIEPDVVKEQGIFLIISSEEFRKETSNELVFAYDRTTLTLQLTTEMQIRIKSKAKKVEKIGEEEEEFEKDHKVHALYCNVQTLNCNNLFRTRGTLQPGNFILISHRTPSARSLSNLVHGIQIGALNTRNIQAALKNLFCCANPKLIVIQDFPLLSELNAPHVKLEEYVRVKETSSWSYWPLRVYERDEKEKLTLGAFEEVEDKDVFLVKEGGPNLNIISQTYPQLGHFADLCRKLSVNNPWKLYSALSSGSFVPDSENKKENLTVALFLIEKDPENMKILIHDFEIIMEVAKHRKDEDEQIEAQTKLSTITLSLFGVNPKALTIAINKYPLGSFFENSLNEPDMFIQHVDTFDYLELCSYDLALILSLIRHFLTCKPPSDVYLRTLLWMYRIESRFMDIEKVDAIRADIEDTVSLKAWDFANLHCTRQTRQRFSNKRRAPIPLETK